MLPELVEDIENARDLFEHEVENGSWPEKWDSGNGQEFLAKYLMEKGWAKIYLYNPSLLVDLGPNYYWNKTVEGSPAARYQCSDCGGTSEPCKHWPK